MVKRKPSEAAQARTKDEYAARLRGDEGGKR